MKKLIILFAATAVLTGYAQTSGQTGTSTTGDAAVTTSTTITTLTLTDGAFLTAATTNLLQEIAIAQLARTHSSNPTVQNFATLVITHDTQALQQAQLLARQLGITLPTTLTAAQVQSVAQFSALTGTSFDQNLIAFIITSHITQTQLFQIAAATGQNAAVRTFARNELSTLLNDFLMAVAIRDALLGI
jgi:putative membrane protein